MSRRLYTCMPLVSAMPQGREGWKLTVCPECGRECWKTGMFSDMTRRGAVSLCTKCAVKKIG